MLGSLLSLLALLRGSSSCPPRPGPPFPIHIRGLPRIWVLPMPSSFDLHILLHLRSSLFRFFFLINYIFLSLFPCFFIRPSVCLPLSLPLSLSLLCFSHTLSPFSSGRRRSIKVRSSREANQLGRASMARDIGEDFYSH